MDYDAIDRAASRYVLTCVDPAGRRFYISVGPGDPATDDPHRARIFRDRTDAVIFRANDRAHWHDAWQKWEPLPALILLESMGA